MSSANGEALIGGTATKRRKVSTTESTSSRSSSTKDDQQTQQQTSMTPAARSSRRIAGKERSYSHKFGYGEDEAILLIGKSEGGSPRKSSSASTKEVKEDEPKPSSPPKKKYSRYQSEETKSSESANGPDTNSRSPKRKVENTIPTSEQTDANSLEKPQELEPKNEKNKSILDANIDSNNANDNKANDDGLNAVDESKNQEMMKDRGSEEITPCKASTDSDPSTAAADGKKRKLRSAAFGASQPTTSRRTTRQTNAEPERKTEPEPDTSVSEKLRKRKVDEIDSIKAELPVEIKKKSPVTKKPGSNGSAFEATLATPSKQIQSRVSEPKYEHLNATKLLIEELQMTTCDQRSAIEDFRKVRDEQQQVINDLRKHRDEQEKLIEDLRKSRNEKQTEIDKLHAQQRASSILFHRERDVNISRYLSDNDMSDNEDAISVENVSPQLSTSGRNPLTFDEILGKVMSYIAPSDLVNCRLVNKQWNSAASDYLRKRGSVSLKYGVTDFMNIFQSSSKLYPITCFEVFLTETFVVDPNTAIFLQRYSKFIEKLDLQLEYFYTDTVSIDNLRSFLPSSLRNLENLVLRLPCKYLSKPVDIPPEEDYASFLNNTPTKLKTLKVVCQCTAMTHENASAAEDHFQSGLLVELLSNSPDLRSFEFKSGRFDSNRTLLRRVVELLNRVNLPRLRNLTLKGLVMQDIHVQDFLPNYQLKSLHLSGIPWEQVEAIWVQHVLNLESLTIGKVMENINLQTTMLEDFAFTSLKELTIHQKIEDPSIFESFSKLFPKLRKLQLRSPTENTVLRIWKELAQLEEVVLDFADEVHEDEKYKIVHLDSLLSGFSVNNCELILKKIMKKGIPQNLDFGTMERFGQGQSIQNMRQLQRLVIKSSSKSLPFRITEVGLVLVLLRMKSLTSITISPCILMKDTMKQLAGRISPAIYLSVACPEKGDDYESAKIALL